MQSIQLNPKRSQLTVMTVGLGVLCGLSFAAPVTGLIAALLVPLFGCPLVRRREEWLAWTVASAPAISALLNGMDVLLTVCLLLPGMLPLMVTRLVKPKERAGAKGFLWYIGATTVALTFCSAALIHTLGGPIAQTLPPLIVKIIRETKNPGLVLYQLAEAGLLSLPEGYGRSDLLMHLMEPSLVRQMLLSLQLTLKQLLTALVPQLFVQACLLVGIFTALRMEKACGVMVVVEVNALKPSERRARVLPPPGFRHLTIPAPLRRALLVMALFSLLLTGSSNTLGSTLVSLLYGTFCCIYQLNGAASVIHTMHRRHPDHLTVIGIIVGVIYALVPTALFLIGAADQIFHFRTQKSPQED